MIDGLTRKCSNCTFAVCTKQEYKKDNCCDLHMFEHEKMIKELKGDKK